MEREQERLEQFRQLRKEIRVSQDYLVVGIDHWTTCERADAPRLLHLCRTRVESAFSTAAGE
jgi:hypothetical protein